MILKLWEYFGIVGLASVLAWTASLYVLARYALSRRRTLVYRCAAGGAVLALLLAWWNSANVLKIREDPNAANLQQQAQQDQLRREARELLAEQASRIRFMEDDKDDRLDLGGVDITKGGNIYELAASGQLDQQAEAPADDTPAWKRGGKKQRAEGKTRAGAKPADEDDAAVAGAESDEEAGLRYLPPDDVVRAHRLDGANLFMARMTLLVCLLALGVDYLARFNRTFGHLHPLPLAGPIVDSISPKAHAVHVQTDSTTLLHHLLTSLTAKGETFVLMTDHPAAKDLPSALHRWQLGPVQWRSIPTEVFDPADEEKDVEFLLDMAWFGRACVVVQGHEKVETFLSRLEPVLRIRDIPHATAAATVNLVWHAGQSHLPLPPGDLDEWLRLLRRTNLRLIAVGPQALPARLTDRFGEQYLA